MNHFFRSRSKYSISKFAVWIAVHLLLFGNPRLADAVFTDEPPNVPREFRAAWVATVGNIDWPSKRGLSVEKMRGEMARILDRAQYLKLNAVVFQVRPCADAFYKSDIEPWSEYLTGIQGKAPGADYDPLAEWVAESHRRGLELHAWFNPYRARHTDTKSDVAANHVSRLHPEAVKSYAGYLWMDPAEPAASEQTLRVILDVVQRYDIDGVHLDDYFYPYPVNEPGSTPAVEAPFPDGTSWQRYLDTNPQPKLSRDDWRRRNVDQLIEKMYRGIKEAKKHVKFGISPFGIGKPSQRPPGIVGFSQYDKLYADAELWLEKGWLDYFSPQLYWPIDQTPQAFGVLLDYWASHNPSDRHIWPGLYTSRIKESSPSWEPQEISRQIELTRNRAASNSLLSGHIHFSMKALMENRKGISDQLHEGVYREHAIIPAFTWLDDVPPSALRLKTVRIGERVELKSVQPVAADIARMVIWKRYDHTWVLDVSSVDEHSQRIDFVFKLDQDGKTLKELRYAPVDRCGNIGAFESVAEIE